MKIYDKIIINIETGKTLYSKHHNYTGQVALCKGGTTVNYPSPSPQEIELLELQLSSLKEMGKDAEAIRPYLLQSMGLKEDPNGNMLKMTEEEYYESLTGLDKAGYDLAMASTERSMKAYAGELEISPALEKSLGQRKEELTETLARNLGSGWQSTTAGIQAMAQFDETSDLVREEVRSGIITNEGGMALSSLGHMSGVAEADTVSFPGAQTGGLFSGAGQMAQHYQRDRQGQFQASAHNAQAKAQRSAGLMSGIGEIAGAGIGAYGTFLSLAAASSRALKKNIKTIKNPVDQIMAIRGVDFTWKTNDMPNKGVIAEELEEVIPEAIFEVGGVKCVEYHQIIPVLVEAIKVQQREIEKLKEHI